MQPEQFFIDDQLISSDSVLRDTLQILIVEDRVKLYIRLNFLLQSQPRFITRDTVFEEFTSALFSYHVGKTRPLKSLYTNMQQAILQWNGTIKEGSNEVNIKVGRSQTSYKITHKLDLVFKPSNLEDTGESIIHKFKKFVAASFKVKNDDEVFTAVVDYDLYKLGVDISRGYRVNAIDKREHLDFSKFVDQISNHKASSKDLLFQQFAGQTRKEYELSYDSGFDTFSFTEKW
jgi:DNA phosphorothioation-dependent restriction protein DptF